MLETPQFGIIMMQNANILKTLIFMWKHKAIKYVTILLVLVPSLYIFTDAFENLVKTAQIKQENKKFFVYLPSKNKNLVREERKIARKLAWENDMVFVNLRPIPSETLKSIIKDIEIEDRLEAGELFFDVADYFGQLKQATLLSMENREIAPINSTFKYDRTKQFVKWLSNISNYETKLKNITPYDAIIKKYARKFNVDWRLIAAQMFAESSYNPKSRSFAGAKGLMQITPIAMKETGLKDPYDIDQNIYHGIKYLKSRINILNNIPKHSRLQFALASYNAGIGHLRDAQKLAKMNRLNHLRWDGHVDEMFLDLAYYDDDDIEISHGYCRGTETVDYVKKIMSRYTIYLNLVSRY